MNARLALITFLDGPVDPGFGGGIGGPRPDQGLPGQPPYPSQGPGFPTHPIAPGGQPPYPSQGLPPFPSQGLPGGGGGRPPRPDQGLPPQHGRPDQGLPGEQPGIDNELPIAPPTASLPIYLPERPERDQKFELKWSPVYGWVLVPVQDEYPDQGLPEGGGEYPDNSLPDDGSGEAQPKY
jgi:hypothetical protein